MKIIFLIVMALRLPAVAAVGKSVQLVVPVTPGMRVLAPELSDDLLRFPVMVDLGSDSESWGKMDLTYLPDNVFLKINPDLEGPHIGILSHLRGDPDLAPWQMAPTGRFIREALDLRRELQAIATGQTDDLTLLSARIFDGTDEFSSNSAVTVMKILRDSGLPERDAISLMTQYHDRHKNTLPKYYYGALPGIRAANLMSRYVTDLPEQTAPSDRVPRIIAALFYQTVSPLIMHEIPQLTNVLDFIRHDFVFNRWIDELRDSDPVLMKARILSAIESDPIVGALSRASMYTEVGDFANAVVLLRAQNAREFVRLGGHTGPSDEEALILAAHELRSVRAEMKKISLLGSAYLLTAVENIDGNCRYFYRQMAGLINSHRPRGLIAPSDFNHAA